MLSLCRWLSPLLFFVPPTPGTRPRLLGRRRLCPSPPEEWDALVLYSELSDAQLCGDDAEAERKRVLRTSAGRRWEAREQGWAGRGGAVGFFSATTGTGGLAGLSLMKQICSSQKKQEKTWFGRVLHFLTRVWPDLFLFLSVTVV